MTSSRSDNRSNNSRLDNCLARWGLFAFGWLCVGLGFIGIFVPGLPTTVFLLIALWAFSKSSERFQQWLWTHPKFGQPIRAWHEHRVIPLRAKIAAVGMMTGSIVIVVLFVAESWLMPVLLGAMMIPVSIYLVSQAGTIQESQARNSSSTSIGGVQ